MTPASVFVYGVCVCARSRARLSSYRLLVCQCNTFKRRPSVCSGMMCIRFHAQTHTRDAVLRQQFC